MSLEIQQVFGLSGPDSVGRGGVGWFASRSGPSARSSVAEIQVKDQWKERRARVRFRRRTRRSAASQVRLIEIAFRPRLGDARRGRIVEEPLERPGGRRRGVPRARPAGARARATRSGSRTGGAARASRTTRSTAREKGQRDGLRAHLEVALEIAERPREARVLAGLAARPDPGQDRPRPGCCSARPTRASQFGAGVDESEAGGLAALHARLADPRGRDQRLAAMEEILAKGNLDQIRNALDACVEMFEAIFADDAARRARDRGDDRGRMEEDPGRARHRRVHSGSRRRPSSKQDPTKARAIAEGGAHDPRRGDAGFPRTGSGIAARLAVVRHRRGEQRGGPRRPRRAARGLRVRARRDRRHLSRAARCARSPRRTRRSGTRRPPLDVYRRALEEGVGNPNSRPRAEDLVATCLSMARDRRRARRRALDAHAGRSATGWETHGRAPARVPVARAARRAAAPRDREPPAQAPGSIRGTVYDLDFDVPVRGRHGRDRRDRPEGRRPATRATSSFSQVRPGPVHRLVHEGRLHPAGEGRRARAVPASSPTSTSSSRASSPTWRSSSSRTSSRSRSRPRRRPRRRSCSSGSTRRRCSTRSAPS